MEVRSAGYPRGETRVDATHTRAGLQTGWRMDRGKGETAAAGEQPGAPPPAAAAISDRVRPRSSTATMVSAAFSNEGVIQ